MQWYYFTILGLIVSLIGMMCTAAEAYAAGVAISVFGCCLTIAGLVVSMA